MARRRLGRATTEPGLARLLGPALESVGAAWIRAARDLDPAVCWRRHLDAGIGIAIGSSPSYPSAFVGDPEPPAIVFTSGDPDVLVGPASRSSAPATAPATATTSHASSAGTSRLPGCRW